MVERHIHYPHPNKREIQMDNSFFITFDYDFALHFVIIKEGDAG